MKLKMRARKGAYSKEKADELKIWEYQPHANKNHHIQVQDVIGNDQKEGKSMNKTPGLNAMCKK